MLGWVVTIVCAGSIPDKLQLDGEVYKSQPYIDMILLPRSASLVNGKKEKMFEGPVQYYKHCSFVTAGI